MGNLGAPVSGGGAVPNPSDEDRVRTGDLAPSIHASIDATTKVKDLQAQIKKLESENTQLRESSLQKDSSEHYGKI